jgi:hypothetical protein
VTIHQIPLQSWAEFKIEAREVLRLPSRYGRLRWRDLDRPGPEHEYVVDGLLSVGDKSILGGPSMSGKSFLAIHLGMTIAYACFNPDWLFFGQRVFKPGLVIYQAGEGARGVKKRLRAFRRKFGIPRDIELPFELLQSAVDLYSPDGDTRGLIDEIAAIKEDYPDLPLVAVFIDTLATATGGADENSGKDMGAVMKNIDALRNATGANICLVHHLNAAGTKLRGHTSILANIDQVLMVERDEKTKIRTLRLGKQKDDDDTFSLRFKLEVVETGRRRLADQREESSCVCVEIGNTEAAQAEAEAEGFILRKAEEGRIFTALLKALDLYGVMPDEEMIAKGLPADRRVVNIHQWREVYAEQNPEDDGTRPAPKAIGQRLRNSKEWLIKGKVMAIWAEHIWWTGKPVRGYRETQREANYGPSSAQPDANPQPGDGWEPAF